MSNKEINYGDVFSIKTTKGLTYLQYVAKDRFGIEQIRVLAGSFKSECTDVLGLVESTEQFIVGFPLLAAYKRKIVNFVGSYPLNNFKSPKFFRTRHNVRGEILGWHIVNAETLYHELVKELTDEQKLLSPWGCWNDTLLIEMLDEGFSLQNW
jgi:hypothetical protein